MQRETLTRTYSFARLTLQLTAHFDDDYGVGVHLVTDAAHAAHNRDYDADEILPDVETFQLTTDDDDPMHGELLVEVGLPGRWADMTDDAVLDYIRGWLQAAIADPETGVLGLNRLDVTE